MPQSSPLPFEEGRRIVIDELRSRAHPPGTESIPLSDAHGRVLADAVFADRPYPALRRSLRDGFAVHSTDLPGVLRVRGETRAGDKESCALARGEALEIMTGAPVPEDADAVVMIEHTERARSEDGDLVKIDRTAEPGQFINAAGAEAPQGTLLVEHGTRLDASHVAMLAMVGDIIARVNLRPRVAVLPTGDELVDIDRMPAPHQLRNSNAYMLASLIRASGGEPVMLPVAPDTRSALTDLLRQGLEHDMLVVSGGVSAGKYDLVKPCLRDLGVTFLFERVRLQPGQPTAFGVLGSKPVFGLPGNPGSSLITFQLFARPALEILGGVTEPVQPFLLARFEAPFRHKLGLTRFLPARMSSDGIGLHHIPWQGSSDVPALAKANVFLIADHDRENWEVGDTIRVMLKI